jgi:glycosyltransferase involved in cell wall biosynthesis
LAIGKWMPEAIRTKYPTVSVICPIYNAAAYLREALDSVLAQDFQGFELLLVDDGSTDGSLEIAREYVGRDPSKIHLFYHPGHANRGASPSRNVGIHHAEGSFYAFIDNDDRWNPAKLREQLAVFDANPEADLVAGTANYWQSWCGGADVLVPSGHVRGRLIRPPEASLRLYPLSRGPAPCPSDIMVRASVARGVGGFEEVFTGPWSLFEDQAFLSKIYLVGNVYFADRVWIDYRLHAESEMHRQLAAGRHHPVRKFFLEWFATYLLTKRPPHFRVVHLQLHFNYLRYRSRWLGQGIDFLKAIKRRLRQGR